MRYGGCVGCHLTKRLHLLKDSSCVGGKCWSVSLAFDGLWKFCVAMGIKQKCLVDGGIILPAACVMMG
jgi:hypothetical protein